MIDSNKMDTSDSKTVPELTTVSDVAPPPSTSPAGVLSAPATSTIDPKSEPIIRDSLGGMWILDKTRGEWSMRGYLETLNVPELAIQANEKGENELDTIQTIELTDEKVKITKQSRVNSNLVVELTYGVELVEYLKPDSRPKKQLATTEDPGRHLKIVSSLLTVNGMANVTDIKRLVQEEEKSSVLIQELTINNPESNKTHTTTRYFNPHSEPGENGRSGELGAAIAAAETGGTQASNGIMKMDTD